VALQDLSVTVSAIRDGRQDGDLLMPQAQGGRSIIEGTRRGDPDGQGQEPEEHQRCLPRHRHNLQQAAHERQPAVVGCLGQIAPAAMNDLAFPAKRAPQERGQPSKEPVPWLADAAELHRSPRGLGKLIGRDLLGGRLLRLDLRGRHERRIPGEGPLQVLVDAVVERLLEDAKPVDQTGRHAGPVRAILLPVELLGGLGVVVWQMERSHRGARCDSILRDGRCPSIIISRPSVSGLPHEEGEG